MTTPLDTLIAAKVGPVLQKYGVDATFTIEIGQGYDPETGKSTRLDTRSYTTKATPPAAYAVRDIDGERVRASDMKAYISGVQTFTPAIGQAVQMASAAWTVVAVSPFYSGDAIAVYELQLRR